MAKWHQMMKRRGAAKRALGDRALARLTSLLGEVGLGLRVLESPGITQPWDILVEVPLPGRKVKVAIEVKALGEPGRLLDVFGGLVVRDSRPGVFPLVFAPYLSPRSAELCRRAGYGYFDEAGNCRIAFENVLISRESGVRPPAPRREARSLFAPKSARIARAFLCEPARTWSQLDLSRELGVSLGLVNRIVRRLQREAYVALEGNRLALKDGDALLQRWAASYSFEENELRECYTPAALEEFEEQLERKARKKGVRYALTLFAGARYRAPFARFNRIHSYLDANAQTAPLQDLGLKEVATGGNVILAFPRDPGVFYQLTREEGRNIVSDVQLYLDLKSYPGRGEEQAEALAARRLSFVRPTREGQ